MKKLSYILGLVAMVVMMTMTSCSGVSEDVQKLCDTFDDAATKIESVKTPEELGKYVENFISTSNDVKIDESTKLTDDDKEALSKSFMNYSSALLHKIIDLGMGYATDAEIESNLEKMKEKVDKVLAESETLGEFSEKISSTQW